MGKRSKKRVLGRGLSVLLGDVDKNTFNEKAQNIDQEVVGKIIELEINEIEINPSQPRSNFSETLIKELADSKLKEYKDSTSSKLKEILTG